MNFHSASLILEDIPHLQTLILGDYVFESPYLCIIRNLPELKEIHLGTNALYLYSTKYMIMDNLPILEKIDSLGASLVCSNITIKGDIAFSYIEL